MAEIINRDLTQPETVEWAKQLLAEERNDEHMEFLQEAAERFPNDPEIRIRYALALMPYRPNEVATQVARAIELEPDNPWRLTRAASLLFDLREFDAARSYVTHASRIARPDFEFAPELSNLGGNLAAQTGEDKLAEEALSAALEVEPERPRFAWDLARFLVDRGRMDEALGVLNEALLRNPGEPTLMQLRDEL